MREQHIHVIRFRGTYDSGAHFGCKIILKIDLLRRTQQTQNQIVPADHIPDHVILFYSADNQTFRAQFLKHMQNGQMADLKTFRQIPH